MSKALYHQEGQSPKEFSVLKKHDDGAVDLGPENGDAVVTRCKVVEDLKPGETPAAGTATLVTASEAKAFEKAEGAEEGGNTDHASAKKAHEKK